MESMPLRLPGAGRLGSLDVTRAIAIIAMIWAHFGPGVCERLSVTGTARLISDLVGRFATPGFVFVFGVTLGVVYLPKALGGNFPQVAMRLTQRSALLVLCVVIVQLPRCVELFRRADSDPLHWILLSYSILSYYVLALVSAAGWLGLALRYGRVVLPCLGVGYWLLHLSLVSVWADVGIGSYAGILRLFLIGGAYAYLPLSGTALLAVGVGTGLRGVQREGGGSAWLVRSCGMGACAILCAIALASMVGEWDLRAIAAGEVKSPPRVWYFLLFSGTGLCLLTSLALAERKLPLLRLPLYPVQLFGQAALPIYVGHMVVGELFLLVRLGFPAGSRAPAVIALGGFAAFCLAMMYRRHLKLVETDRRKSEPASVAAQDSLGPPASAASVAAPQAALEGGADSGR